MRKMQPLRLIAIRGKRLPLEIAQSIQKGRARKGYTQRKLAALMDVAPSAVAQWETGAAIPTLANRAGLCRILGIPLVEMLPEVGKISVSGQPKVVRRTSWPLVDSD